MTDTAVELLTNTKTIPELLDLLGQVREKRAEYETILQPMREDEDSIRLAIDVLMRENDIARTKPVNGLYAVMQERKQTTVVDAHAAMAYLEERNELGAFMKLDTGAVMKRFPKGIPGIRVIANPTLAINTVKAGEVPS